ncbi:MAG: CBS domain-containing protein [Nanoarchaeota archaeon]|nr:CBS domain-containing protein [Nanoarchaeota archaeon]
MIVRGGENVSIVKTAYDIARKQVFFCRSNEPIKEIARKLHVNNIGSILVKKDGDVAGIITVNDLLRQMSRNTDVEKTLAEDIMSSPVVSVDKDLEIDELVEQFNKQRVSRMVLKDKKGEIVGVVRDIAVYKYLAFMKYDKEARKMFDKDYLHKLY